MAILIVAVVGLLLFVMIWMTCNLLWVRKDRIQNDDAVAKDTFLEVLDAARKELLVKDDGDDSSSLYFDNGIAQRVASRLEANERLVIRMLFNCRHEQNRMASLQDTEKYRDRSRLDVRYADARPTREVHCKIADGGRHGCLSMHAAGARKRELEKFDCTVSWLGGKIVFWKHVKSFRQQFAQAAP